MAKISETQRNYFINRVENSIKDEINIIRQKNSVKIALAAEIGYKDYLKELKIDRYMKELRLVSEKKDKLMRTLKDVVRTISPYRDVYKYEDVEEFFKGQTRDIADKQFSKTEAGKRINELEDLRTKSIDYLYGLNNNSEIARGLNEILNPKGVKLIES